MIPIKVIDLVVCIYKFLYNLSNVLLPVRSIHYSQVSWLGEIENYAIYIETHSTKNFLSVNQNLIQNMVFQFKPYPEHYTLKVVLPFIEIQMNSFATHRSNSVHLIVAK